MKVLAINCSPRKNWNTAKLLKSALEGAKSTGAEVEYMDLYDYVFTGCRACDYSSYLKGSIDVELILTMNATEDFYEKLYKRPFEAYAEEFRFLNGNIHVTPCFNTLQVHDYSKFNMAGFSEEAKKKHHDEHFSLDLKKAYERGVLLSS